MRLPLPALLLSLIAVTGAARADTFQFTFNGDFQPLPPYVTMSYPTLTFSWQISGPPEFYLYDDQYPDYRYAFVPLPGNPFASEANLTLYAYAPIEPGDTEEDVTFFTNNGSIYDEYGFGGISVPQGFYTGPQSDPTFLPGSYQAQAEFYDYTLYNGTLTIADLSTGGTVTPEPSSVTLLGTGLVGFAALVRRRLGS